MGPGASSATPCLAGFFALRCFSAITIWVTPESWAVKPITSLPHWFYTRILRVPKCFSPQAFSLTPKSAHNLGFIFMGSALHTGKWDPCERRKTSMRSEEHTSELQSRLHLVCRLLLEKKKIPNTHPYSS